MTTWRFARRNGWERFDRVILATHTDQALRLLEDPTPQERSALGAIAYRRNEAVLHTDDSVLAAAPSARASWNCHLDDCSHADAPLRMTYDLSRLQRLESKQRYCVTLNDDGRVAPDHIIARMRYAHPVYTADGIDARSAASRPERLIAGPSTAAPTWGTGFTRTACVPDSMWRAW